MQAVVPELKLYSFALNSAQYLTFSHFSVGGKPKNIRGFVWSRLSSVCMLTSLRFGREWFRSHKCLKKIFLFCSRSFLVDAPCLECNAYRWFFLRGTIVRNLKLTAYLLLVPSQRMRGDISLFHSNQLWYLLYRRTQTIRPPPGAGCNSRRLTVSSDSD